MIAALDESLPRPQLPMRVQAVPLPGNGAEPLTPVQMIVEIDGSGLSFAPEDGSQVERLEIALKTVDDLARESNRTTTETTLRLTEAERDRATRSGVRWMTTITLSAGHHSLRVAAHAATAGRTGSVFADVDVPGVGPDDGWVSDLVVTSTAAAAAFTGGSPSILPLPGPPNTARRFRRGDALAFAAALHPVRDDAGTVRVTVARLDESGETAIADHVLDRQPSPRGGNYVSFALPTSGLTPGRYIVRLSAGPPGSAQPSAASVLEFEVEP